MTILRDFVRVSRSRRCPVCGRPDWCLVSRDDPPSRVICSRIAEGSKWPCGEAGYMHVLRDDGRPRPAPSITIPFSQSGGIDFDKLAEQFRAALDDVHLARLADGLGVTADSLRRLGVGWSAQNRAWSFPMTDAAGTVRGIRLRCVDGHKLAVRGGRDGLFVAGDLPKTDRLLICEGPTDTAALLDLGFSVVGRPSCTSGVRFAAELAQQRHPREVVVVADADESGRRGAQNLASVLVAYAPAVRIVEPPQGVKDAREWKRYGAATADVLAAIEAAPVRKLTITTTVVERKAEGRHER